MSVSVCVSVCDELIIWDFWLETGDAMVLEALFHAHQHPTQLERSIELAHQAVQWFDVRWGGICMCVHADMVVPCLYRSCLVYRRMCCDMCTPYVKCVCVLYQDMPTESSVFADDGCVWQLGFVVCLCLWSVQKCLI